MLICTTLLFMYVTFSHLAYVKMNCTQNPEPSVLIVIEYCWTFIVKYWQRIWEPVCCSCWAFQCYNDLMKELFCLHKGYQMETSLKLCNMFCYLTPSYLITLKQLFLVCLLRLYHMGISTQHEIYMILVNGYLNERFNSWFEHFVISIM